MPLSPDEILQRLTAIVPGFAAYFESVKTAYREDAGSFTRCGVFADCAIFVRDHYEELSPPQRRQLADFVLECMSQADDLELGDAAATCFLENLTFERFARDFESYLAGDALEFYRRFQGT